MEVQILAVANNADESRHGFAYIQPTSFKITADAIVQKDLANSQKVSAELWQNGFVDNADFPQPGRLCFAAHCANNSHVYTGGYNQQLTFGRYVVGDIGPKRRSATKKPSVFEIFKSP